ncbi:hypothetical protein DICPUDRAFT_33852 [Dictyostelium purpureum]|uniref:Biogenesis of lysosome-related organelles complex 1 subunit 5 n=1 Tax=Dictyostelium purpureum TaxID=5786 RepID=F0ZLM9_DICPU|nr:uncharacterized protein DICPUDRAFT_33852 [Dictyostelium purpureum]EGC35141.1 hypothetical protein DICPUDRAFT_33852 [Dictyostelium purpureum]|eukprot:XP_003288334.1 hypothetical protein DICPUDRAFT_33852 [Dictyostelium purpureum]
MSNNAKDKKITINSMDTLIRDIGTVYEFYFDQNTFVENEVKTFLKEFETKRGDRDIISLSQQTFNANATMAIINKSLSLSKQHLSSINTTLSETNKRINEQLLKENSHQEQRDTDRINKHQIELMERKNVEDNYNKRKEEIEREFNEKASQLRDKYQIVL